MIASAKARYVRISPFKVRRLLGLVKNRGTWLEDYLCLSVNVS